jgi:hypothetical protein
MASKFKSFLDSAARTISGTSTPTGKEPTHGAAIEELFPKVDKEIDGEDCDHDCESCTVKLPRGWDIDEQDQMYGVIKGWSTHVLVATGKSDWVRDVEDEKGSVMEAFGQCGVKPSNGVSLVGKMAKYECARSCLSVLLRRHPIRSSFTDSMASG